MFAYRFQNGLIFRKAIVCKCKQNAIFCYTVASGCLCFGLRAALLMIQMAASRLSLVAIRFFALIRCYGLGFNYCANKTHQNFSKSNSKNNQIHGQIASFPKGRRCQHAGLTPLTSCYSTGLPINAQTNVRIPGLDASNFRMPIFLGKVA